jgi:hypothetical protein
MLRTFFFVLSLLSDYRGLLELLQTSAVSAVVNTGVFLTVLSCAWIRRLVPPGVGQR